MTNSFKRLMREQIQEKVDDFLVLLEKPIPRKGWLRTMREALGMSCSALSKRLGCSKTNVVSLERREKQGTISLSTLEQAAKALNCHLVYCVVPLKKLDQMVEEQARMIAKKQLQIINYSMKLEEQGLTPAQMQRQEDDLVKELLLGNPKKLWVWDDYEA